MFRNTVYSVMHCLNFLENKAEESTIYLLTDTFVLVGVSMTPKWSYTDVVRDNRNFQTLLIWTTGNGPILELGSIGVVFLAVPIISLSTICRNKIHKLKIAM